MIVWDEPKRAANLAKHGLDLADLDVEFFLKAVIIPARGGRHKAVNLFEGRVVTAIFLPLGTESIAVISLRPAGSNEREVIR